MGIPVYFNLDNYPGLLPDDSTTTPTPVNNTCAYHLHGSTLARRRILNILQRICASDTIRVIEPHIPQPMSLQWRYGIDELSEQVDNGLRLHEDDCSLCYIYEMCRLGRAYTLFLGLKYLEEVEMVEQLIETARTLEQVDWLDNILQDVEVVMNRIRREREERQSETRGGVEGST